MICLTIHYDPSPDQPGRLISTGDGRACRNLLPVIIDDILNGRVRAVYSVRIEETGASRTIDSAAVSLITGK
jgi:hypothetical protein